MAAIHRLDSGRLIATCQCGPAATSGGFGTVVEDSVGDQLHIQATLLDAARATWTNHAPARTLT
jgi:hypothetical protein